MGKGKSLLRGLARNSLPGLAIRAAKSKTAKKVAGKVIRSGALAGVPGVIAASVMRRRRAKKRAMGRRRRK